MATIVYLDVDDEITSAAARIRGTAEERIALVVPHGSRLATSRINFRLLAREASARGRNLGIVAPDAATRALAASAGLDAFGSVGAYEASMAPPAPPPEPPAAAPPEHVPAPEPEPTVVMPVVPHGPEDSTGATGGETAGVAGAAAGGAAAAGVAATGAAPVATGGPAPAAPAAAGPAPAAPSARPTRPAPATRVVPPGDRARRAIPRPVELLRGRGVALAIVAVIAVVAVVGGVAAYLLLPSANITVTPRIETVGPLPLTVVAEPDATEPDAEAAVIPATRLTFELEASDTFEATGQRVESSRATGQVTFESLNPAGPNTIPAGAVVSTEGGIRFRTAGAVTLPPAQIIVGVPITIQPSSANVRVEAVSTGPAGNVPANAITVVPEGEDPNLTRVRNRAPTEGGRRQEFILVRQADVDGAVERLMEDIEAQFEAQLEDPSLVPAGSTLFRETARLGEPTTTPNPTDLVGSEIEAFELTMMATATVIAVDPGRIEPLAESRITSGVGGDYRLIEGSVVIDVGRPSVSGESVSYPVTAQASRVRTVDGEALLEEVKGMPIPRARSFLEEFGVVAIQVWPDWVTSIPTLDNRVTLTVGPAASPEPAASRPPSASPRASGPAASPGGASPSATRARSPGTSPEASPTDSP